MLVKALYVCENHLDYDFCYDFTEHLFGHIPEILKKESDTLIQSPKIRNLFCLLTLKYADWQIEQKKITLTVTESYRRINY